MYKKWVTLFPEAKNIHLIKDVGYIPYVMGKKYEYDSYIACYNNDDYSYLNTEVKGLNTIFIKKITGNSFLDSLFFIIANARKINVLQFFHFRKAKLLWVLVYKLLNTSGKVYLKLDANDTIKNAKFNQNNLKDRIFIFLLKKIDLITVETTILHEWLSLNWPVKVDYLPNGFWRTQGDNFVRFEEKENIISTVGRIGAKEKANEILIQAFSNIHYRIPEWKLRFVGPITEEFREYARRLISQNDGLEKKIEFTGAIYNLDKLNYQYKKSKIFCMTSLYESFGLVFVEALKNGCYIITTDVLAARDITKNGLYGSIFETNNYKQLEKILLETCNNQDKLRNICSEIQTYADKNFNWETLCEKIENRLNYKFSDL